MLLEKELCSAELCKQLKEIGIKQESLYYWYWSTYDPESHKYVLMQLTSLVLEDNPYPIAAFSASELISIVPKFVCVQEYVPFNYFNFKLSIRRIYIEDRLVRIYSINYYCDSAQLHGENAFFCDQLFKHNIYDEILANCLAKVILRLNEEKLLIIEEIKNG